jgi:ribosomal protein S18 acetylase RimI-like enzyme
MLAIRGSLAPIDPISRCDRIPTLENTKTLLSQPDTADRIILVMKNGRPVGYTQMTWWEETDGPVYRFEPWLTPEAQCSNELLVRVLNHTENHLRAIAQRRGRPEKAALACNTSGSFPQLSVQLESRGYELVWTMVEMKLANYSKIKLISPSADVYFTKPSEADYRNLWNLSCRAYAGAFGETLVTETDYNEFVGEALSQPNYCDVAWYKERIIGAVLSSVRAGYGDINEVIVDPGHRRQGIGRSLLMHNLAHFAQRGITAVRLQTDASNQSGARTMYESVGFVPRSCYPRYRRPFI